MSCHLSSLNASGCCKFEEFNLKDIEVHVEKEDQQWFKQAHITKYLGMCDIDITTARLGQGGKQIRVSLESGSNSHRYDGEQSWSGHKDQQYYR